MEEPRDYTWDYADPRQYLEKTKRGLHSLPPLIVTVAITGSVHGKESCPGLPETAEEQAEQAYQCYQAGASIVHVHARDKDNPRQTSYSGEDYLRINSLIRDKCPDMIINNTTSGLPGIATEQRLAGVEHAKPELASLDNHAFILRVTLKPREPGQPPTHIDACIPWTYGETEQYAKKMMEKNVKPEIEIYDSGEFWFSDFMIREGLVNPPYWFQFVMGFQSGMYATPANLLTLISHLPPNSLFSVLGVGVTQVPMVTMSILLGGHVRVGLEDNIFLEPGKLAKSNADFVEWVVRLARDMGRPIATPKQARQMLGISEKPTQYK